MFKYLKKYNFGQFTKKCEFISHFDTFKSFRIIDLDGKPVSDLHKKCNPELLNRIFQKMIEVDETDRVLYMAQRQGKISFYMTSFGETAAVIGNILKIGTAAGIEDTDLIFPQYREQGAIMWRGFTVHDMINQCMGNIKDYGKGRQMPVHYGSSKFNYMTVSSPLSFFIQIATQVPQASGAGYSFRINNENRIAMTYFGEGAASEGDFHSALNFAATLNAQTLFICRNNRYAISTPIQDQYNGDGIAVRGPGYGIATLRVDGNDALAVLQATQNARSYIIEHKKPVLLELMTYRIGDHSTSDHSVLYRTEEELKQWQEHNNPIIRLQKYLQHENSFNFTEQQVIDLKANYRQVTIDALKDCKEHKFSSYEDLFNDVYSDLTENLKEQKKNLEDHLKLYKDKYNPEKFQ